MIAMATNRKTERVIVRVSPAQKVDLERAAEFDGQSLADFLRCLGLRRARDATKEAKAAA
jgi:uncharacterized protein (DUF1778 family)